MSRGESAGARVLRAALAAGFVAGALDIVAAFLYYGARRAPVYLRRALCVAVYAFMNLLVLPLSAVTRRPFGLDEAGALIAIHIACVGIPIAWIARLIGRADAQR